MAVTGRSIPSPGAQRGAGTVRGSPGDGGRWSRSSGAEEVCLVSAGGGPRYRALSADGMSELRWYHGAIRPETERSQGVFFCRRASETSR